MAQDVKQTIALPELNRTAGAAELELRTYKGTRGDIVSSAHVHFAKDGSFVFL